MKIHELIQDLRFAVRALYRRAHFSVAAVLTLALAIGATTAVFSVIDGVLLRPLPVADQDRVLIVWKSLVDRGFERMPLSYASYDALRERVHTADLAAFPYYGSSRVVAYRDADPLPLQIAGVTGEFFGLLAVQALDGRLLTTADDDPAAEPALVLSSGTATRIFGAAQHALGERLRVGEKTYVVVGTVVDDFAFPGRAEAWVAASHLFLPAPNGGMSLHDATRVSWYIVARALPGFSTAQVSAEVAGVLPTLATESAWLGRQEVRSASYADVVIGDMRTGLLLLGGAVLLVLVMAGANVANLLLTRGIARRREMAVRAALGASRGRLHRQLSIEAFVLVGIGTALATIAAHGLLRMLLALAPDELPRLDGIGMDARALTFAGLTSFVTALVFGLLPAVRTARADHAALRSHEGGGEPGTRAWLLRHGLVAAQFAIATLVLSGAGLLLLSFEKMQQLEPGFATDDITLVEIDVPPSRYPVEANHQLAIARLAEHAASLPGVTAATAVLTQPFAGNAGFDAIWYGEQQTLDAAANPFSNYEGADAAYFSTMDVPILSGRGITGEDRADGRLVVVVNETFARLYWPDSDPIGLRIKMGRADSPTEWRTVVGLAADTRYRDLQERRPTVYVPYGQGIPVRPRYVAVRANMGASTLRTLLREIVAAQEPGAAVAGMTPLSRLFDVPLARPRFQSSLLTAFALLGLTLAVTGTYGVLAFFVKQRTREIGIRMALGANPASVRRLVLRHALAIASIGVAFGIAGALAAGRLIETALFDVDAADPIVLSTVAVALLASSVAAAVLPARSATRTDPLLVMRAD